MLREDFVERMIRQLAQALARVLGLRRRGDLTAAAREADAALAGFAGADPRLLDAADPAMLAATLEPERIVAIGRLLAERAAIEAERGDGPRAAASRDKALAYLLEAAARAPLDADAVRAARALVEAGAAIPPRHAAAAERIARGTPEAP